MRHSSRGGFGAADGSDGQESAQGQLCRILGHQKTVKSNTVIEHRIPRLRE